MNAVKLAIAGAVAPILRADRYSGLMAAARRQQNPELRAKQRDVQKKVWSNPELRAKAAERGRKLAQDPEWRARCAEGRTRHGAV